MEEMTLLDPEGYDLSETILIDYRLYYAKHGVCQLCGDETCVQYWVEGNGVSKCDTPLLNDVMIYGKLFGRCKDCRIENSERSYYYQPRLDLFPLDERAREFSGIKMYRYDPNRDSIVSDTTFIEWVKIN
jgi:hypothetical protein